MEKLVFETPNYRGYNVKAYYLNDGSNNARVELWNGDTLVQTGQCPAYKVFNYQAHANDMIDDLVGDLENLVTDIQ
jgi:hypothetical protein